ncbi:MAG: hypothetical protein QM820_56890 [Minicystis sp.]
MRVLHLKDTARDAIHALAPRGTDARAAVMRVLRELMDERIPLVGPEDRSVVHGPFIMGRAVPGAQLIICYVPGRNEVFVVNLIRR